MANHSNRSPWLRRTFFVIGLAGIVYLGLLFVLSRYLDPEVLAASLEPRMEAALAREVGIGRVEVGFFPLGIRLQDLSVADPTGLAPELARIETVEFQVELLPLLEKEVRIRRLKLENPEANLRVAADGRSNFGDFSAEASRAGQDEEPGTAEALALEFSSIRISGGRISFINEENPATGRLDNLQLRADVQREAAGGWVFVGDSEGRVSFEKGSYNRGGISLPLVMSFDLLAGPSFEEVEIRSGTLGVEPVALALAGTIGQLKEPLRSVSLSLVGERLPLSGFVEALPDRLRSSHLFEAGGTANADLRIEGDLGPGSRPEISGTVRLANASLTRDGVWLARALTGDLSLAPGAPARVSVGGEVVGGPFALEGEGELGGERKLDLQLDAYPDLALLGSLVGLPEGVSTEGRLETEVHITGSARDPRSLRFWGEASPNFLRITTPSVGVPITVRGGVISLQGNTAAFRDIPIALDLDQLIVTGQIRRFTSFGEVGETVEAHASIRGPKLDLPGLTTNAPPDSTLSYGKVAFARLGGRQVEGRSVEDAARELHLLRPDSIPLAGTLTMALDTVVDAKGRMEDVRATVEFGPDFLRVSDLDFRRYGGSLQARMDLFLGEDAEEPFSMGLVVDDLDAEEFLRATSPLGEAFRGRLSLNLELVGSLDSLLLPNAPSLEGSGRFSLTEGGLSSTLITESVASFLGLNEFRAPEISEWTSSFVLENGRFRLPQAPMRGAPGEPRVAGSVGLDGGLDILSILTLPANRLSGFARENLGLAGEVAGRVANRPDMVRAVIRIGGSIISPELVADPLYFGGAPTDPVDEETRTEAREETEEPTSRLRFPL